MQVIGSRQASNRFGSLLNTVQIGEPVTITRNNQKAAIMLSPLDFELLGGEKILSERRNKYLEQQKKELRASFDAMQEEAEKNGLTQEILDDIIKNG
jgi:prevent-host-death family protein